MPNPIDVLAFWWQAGPSAWFSSDPDFDAACRDQFLEAHEAAASGALDDWAAQPHSALALIILLDQLPRNMFRGTPRMFATDEKAMQLAEDAIANGLHLAYPLPVRRFFHMPFMHAESIGAQERCIDLCRADGDDDGYHYALVHMDAIRRFGRFPHRNEVLGRKSSVEELAYLKTGGFSG